MFSESANDVNYERHIHYQTHSIILVQHVRAFYSHCLRKMTVRLGLLESDHYHNSFPNWTEIPHLTCQLKNHLLIYLHRWCLISDYQLEKHQEVRMMESDLNLICYNVRRAQSTPKSKVPKSVRRIAQSN